MQPAPHRKVDVLCLGHVSEVGLQDLAAPLDVRIGHHHVAVKAPRTYQRLVQRLWEVCGRYANHTLAGFEPAGSAGLRW